MKFGYLVTFPVDVMPYFEAQDHVAAVNAKRWGEESAGLVNQAAAAGVLFKREVGRLDEVVLTYLYVLPDDPKGTTKQYTNEAFNDLQSAKNKFDIKPPTSSDLFLVPSYHREGRVGFVTLCSVELGSGQPLKDNVEVNEEEAAGGFATFLEEDEFMDPVNEN